MKNSKGAFWTICIIAVAVVGIFLYAANKNNRYANTLENSITSNSNAALSTYTDATYGFSISYPNSFIATSTFASSYLLPSYWNLNAPEGTGEEVVAIEYPGSNNILSSELRIGVSDEVDQVVNCDKFRPGLTPTTHSIDGEQFYIGATNDAAMSHFSHVESYRIVHNNACYALDLVSFGTNPEVYSPPKTAPFDEKKAEAALEQVADSFIFNQ